MRPWLLLLAACLAVNAAGERFVMDASSGRYSVIQRYIDPEDPQDEPELGAWEAVVQFADKSKPDATLAAEPDRYLWPAAYLISPDERWILRLQKTGSGENSALLYRVDSTVKFGEWNNTWMILPSKLPQSVRAFRAAITTT